MVPNDPLRRSYFVRVCAVAIRFSPPSGSHFASAAESGRSFYQCFDVMYADMRLVSEAASCWAMPLRESRCVLCLLSSAFITPIL